jgi:hypothetical protein
MIKKILSIFILMLFLNIIISTIVSAEYNNPPYPPIIEGTKSGKKGVTYNYNFTITDPDPDDVLFNLEINFGDEETVYQDCGCGKSWQNGTVITVSHRWKKQGDYEITARVQDSNGEWSEWSQPFLVNMVKSNNLYKINIIEQHFYKFQIITNLIKKFLNLKY